ncbi:MAG: site-2 protease family protein [Phycisphaerae bacterium]|nr:site-2 protease family protein [Phycisphaerae bacterium]
MLANVVTDILSQIVWPLVQFILGLGVVVFFHELGHFLAARWAGIKVERFAIGMGPRLWGVVKGETDYCICAIPLGGYVKMLGQEDFKPVEGEDGIDPRSFLAKPVGKRMVVISAGVVMNVILAAVLFIIIGMVGKKDNAPIVGDVSPALPVAYATITWEPTADVKNATPPASDTGLQPGDRIVSINGEAVKHFGDIHKDAILAQKGETFDFVIQRDADGVTWTGKTRVPVKYSEQEGINQFGLSPALSLKVGKNTELIREIPFQEGDLVKAINGQAVKHQWRLNVFAEGLDGKECTVTVERENGEESPVKTVDIPVSPTVLTRGDIWYQRDGSRVVGWPVDPPTDATEEAAAKNAYLQTPDGKTLTLPSDDLIGGAAVLLDVLGMTPRIKVDAVVKGGVIFRSPAQKAGLQPGDIILSYADRPTPSGREFLEISKDVGSAPTSIVVRRGKEVLHLTITPSERDGSAKVGIAQGPDLAHPIVGSVRENSPAAKIGIEKGAEIIAINNQKVHSWLDVITTLKKFQGQKVVLQGKVGTEDRSWTLDVLDKNSFNADEYKWSLLSDVPFLPKTVTVLYRNPLKAVAWGAAETGRLVVLTYKSFGAMIRGSVSAKKAVQGPIGIGSLAVSAAREDFMSLVRLMAFLSVALAVFNFLPIPVLDGGHALLLIIEKLRGKPLPLKFVNILQMVFLFLILGLFLLISWNDVLRILRNLW